MVAPAPAYEDILFGWEWSKARLLIEGRNEGCFMSTGPAVLPPSSGSQLHLQSSFGGCTSSMFNGYYQL